MRLLIVLAFLHALVHVSVQQTNSALSILQNLPEGVDLTKCALDLVFILDASVSEGANGLGIQKQIVTDVTSHFTLGSGPTETQVAIAALKSPESGLYRDLNGNEPSTATPISLNAALDDVAALSGAGSDLGYVMHVVNVMLEDPTRGKRNDVQTIIFCLTDGAANDPDNAKTIAELWRDNGIIKIAIAIVGAAGNNAAVDFLAELVYVDDFLLPTQDFESVLQITGKLALLACKAQGKCALDFTLILDCTESTNSIFQDAAKAESWHNIYKFIIDKVNAHPFIKAIGPEPDNTHIAAYCIKAWKKNVDFPTPDGNADLFPEIMEIIKFEDNFGAGTYFLADFTKDKIMNDIVPKIVAESVMTFIAADHVAQRYEAKLSWSDAQRNMRWNFVVIDLETSEFEKTLGSSVPPIGGPSTSAAALRLKQAVLTAAPNQVPGHGGMICGYDSGYDFFIDQAQQGWPDLEARYVTKYENAAGADVDCLIPRPIFEQDTDFNELGAIIDRVLGQSCPLIPPPPQTTTGITPPPQTTMTPTERPEENTAPTHSFCEQCWERRNQKDYYTNPENCSTYFHCFRDGSEITGILMECPPGLRFDEGILQCVPKFNDSCEGKSSNDPCNDPNVMMEGYWQAEGECGIFYQCSNYYSIKMCCPPFHRFNISWRDCMYDKSCTHHNEECGQFGTTIPMFSPELLGNRTCHDRQYGVTRQQIAENPHEYYVIIEPYIGDKKWIKMFCPPGTLFQLETCKCSNHTDWEVTYPPMKDCLVDLRFNEIRIKDFSKYRFWVDNFGEEKVQILLPIPANTNFSVGHFLGNAHIELPGLAGNALGQRMTIMFWFFIPCDDMANSTGGIVSNFGEAGIPASILIWKDDDVIFAGVRTTKANLLDSVNAQVQCGLWYHFALVYEVDVLTLYINCVKVDMEEAQEPGLIYWMMHCPLAIGNDQIKGYYKGYLDNFLLCREAFTPEEICLSMNSDVNSSIFGPFS